MDKSAEKIVEIDVAAEMRESFLEYSYSVIYSRALPDARDGLKPVQRRIIYQMGEMGLRPDRGHVKSARVTGEVMGKLHPHGDSAIYDALVRMSQPFSLRMPLIDGHGNFGSLDDGPAAARYTEARLASAALLLNESLEEDTVDFEPNYDAQLSEPAVLPAAFPNLLVNGASGIAVGMATNMPPHNLGEVIAALLLMLKRNVTLSEVMQHIPGPDLPTGGQILVADGLREAYETGRGTFRMRARIAVESVAPRRTGLVITELPYLVGPERVIEKIRDAVNAKKLEGIHNVVDLTDRENGLKLVVELKSGIDPSSVIEALYRLTPLEESFGVNNVALVEGRPQQLGLLDLLSVYLRHRLEVTRRRSQNRLDKRNARLHLIDGLQVAVLNIDEVIELIRTSDTAEDAKARLRTVFDFSDLQAEYILELRLRRLTKFSIIELTQEADQLRREIEELASILASDEKLRQVVSAELSEVAKLHGTPRRTELLDASGLVVSKKPVQVTEIADTETFVTLSPTGKVFRSEQAGDKTSIATSMRSDVGFVLDDGSVHRVHVADLPVDSAALEAQEFLHTSQTVLAIVDWQAEQTYALGTAQGIVKRLQGPLPDREEVALISLKDGDHLVGFAPADDDALLAFVSDQANLLLFGANQVRPQGLPASGMLGMKLDGARAIKFAAVAAEMFLVTAANSSLALGATDAGSAKMTPVSAYPTKGRGTMGVRCQRFLRGEDQLYFAGFCGAEATWFDGADIEIPALDADPRRDASGKPIATYLAAVG